MDRRDFLMGAGSVLAYSGLALPKAIQAEERKSIQDIRNKALDKIAFGSCNRQYLPQSHWSVIAQDKPDLWLWLGDNIYADGLSLEQRIDAWSKIKNHVDYASLRQSTAVMGTWDDHDYGSNNQGIGYKDKIISQEIFSNFLDIPADHQIRQQDGIYHSEVIGPAGKQTQLFMLDLRYFKDNPATGTLLGEAQMAWLEKEFRQSTADLIIVISSIHLTSGITGFGLEGWNSYPKERQRFYDMVEALDVPVLVLSGDRHMAEFTRKTLNNGKPLYEFMSSGLTHGTFAPIPDPGRIGRATGRNNYGLINIDWTGNGPQLALQIKDSKSQGIIQQILPKFL